MTDHVEGSEATPGTGPPATDASVDADPVDVIVLMPASAAVGAGLGRIASSPWGHEGVYLVATGTAFLALAIGFVAVVGGRGAGSHLVRRLWRFPPGMRLAAVGQILAMAGSAFVGDHATREMPPIAYGMGMGALCLGVLALGIGGWLVMREVEERVHRIRSAAGLPSRRSASRS